MDIEYAIRYRRSVRRYNDKVVTIDELKKIIEAGMWAPSACNFQMWKFIIIDQPLIFQKLKDMGGAEFLVHVHQGILVLYNNQTDNLEYHDDIQSAAAAIENMLLMSKALNIGTCWVNNLPNKERMRDVFHIPKTYDPIALVTIGYYDHQINDRPRHLGIEEMIAYNGFDFPNYKEKNQYIMMIRRIARRIYKKTPGKNLMRKFIGKLEKKFDN